MNSFREYQPSGMCCLACCTPQNRPKLVKSPALPLQIITESCHSVPGSQEPSPHQFPNDTGLSWFLTSYSAFGLCNNKWLTGRLKRGSRGSADFIEGLIRVGVHMLVLYGEPCYQGSVFIRIRTTQHKSDRFIHFSQLFSLFI